MNELERGIVEKRILKWKEVSGMLKAENWFGFLHEDNKFKILFSILGAENSLDKDIYFAGLKK